MAHSLSYFFTLLLLYFVTEAFDQESKLLDKAVADKIVDDMTVYDKFVENQIVEHIVIRGKIVFITAEAWFSCFAQEFEK